MTVRQIAFDTETTGLDPVAGHRIVEIGCVEMRDYIRTGRVFHAYINPERDMPPEAERIHGLSAAFLADKPVFRDVARPFIEFVADAVLVAHNASFDMKFINYELKQAGLIPLDATKTIDTLEIVRRRYPGQPASLDALCKRFNVDLSAREKHGALLDAELLADVYLELMGGRQASFGLHKDGFLTDEQQKHSHLDDNKLINTLASLAKVTDFPIRQYTAAPEEIEKHQLFIQKYIKSSFWTKYHI